MRSLQALLALFACAALPLHAAGLADLTYTTTDGKVTITDCNTAATGELVIPDTIGGFPVTSIQYSAFQNCTSLTSITIPDSVTSIGFRAFGGCTSLTSITIPEGVTSIPAEAFLACLRLTNINIPLGVTSIGDGAFYSCNNLTSITIPDSVTSIGSAAFSSCTSLTSITIGNGVTSIGVQAFVFSSSLTSIIFLGAAPAVGDSAFFGVRNGAVAEVLSDFAESFGGIGSTWEGLTVSRLDYTIEVATVTGSGTVEGAGSFGIGSSVTLTATPDAGYHFVGWSGDTTGSTNPLTLNLESDMNIGAIFLDLASYGLVTQTDYDVAVTAARTAGRGDVTSDPASYNLVTQASYDAVVAERDARFTEDQIHAMSADYTIGLNDAGNVEIKIFFIKSADLQAFTPFTVNPESVSVVDGKICLEFPSEDRGFFFRFRVE